MVLIETSVLAKYHVVVTTYDTVKSEYVSHSPSAKDESKKSKASSKAKAVDSDDDSESEGSSRLKKSKTKAGAKRCALFGIKWWRVVLGAFF